MKKSLKFLCATALFLLTSTIAQAAFSEDMSINSQDITFSPNNFLEGKNIRIYATAKNNSTQDLLGVVRFFDNKKQIGGDQPISIFGGKTDGVFIDWAPPYGSHEIAVKIFPFEPKLDDPANNWIVDSIFIIRDTDHDGTPNDKDQDDDGDGVEDTKDFSPLDPNEQYDTDGDGKGNKTDEDDDNDGVPDKHDDMPLDPNESTDTDKDGVGNIADTDDDNDSVSDTDEENNGTEPLKADTDNDGSNDKEDFFPLNPSEQLDTDQDSIGNNTDIDDDNDGTPDDKDEFPLNKGPVIKLTDKKITTDIYQNFTFDASPSYDEDGQIVSYIWEIDKNEIKEGNAINHAFKSEGPHTVKLTVTDNQGESRIKEIQVSVMNITLYKQLGLVLLLILLASFIYFKYIHHAKN